MFAGPIPLFAEVTCSQAALLLAFHVHADSPESAKLPFCARGDRLAERGLMAKLQAGPVCVIVMLCCPTVIAPVRIGVSLSAATVNPAVPSPAPVWPKSMVIQLTAALAILTQVPELATMFRVPAPPVCGKDRG